MKHSDQFPGALILAGGQNRRMNGSHKALLKFHGQPLLVHLAAAFNNFDEKLISTGVTELADLTGFTPVADEIPGMGPLGGLTAALSVCRSPALVVCACDMPFISAAFVSWLAELGFIYPKAQAIIIKDRSGRIHPLCGLYRTSAVDVLKTALDNRDLRVMQAFNQLDGIVIPLADSAFPDSILTNVNTPEDFSQLLIPDK